MFFLAPELIDKILTEINEHEDLINLARTSRTAASYIIPRHSDYRVLKIGRNLSSLWTHFAEHPDLARHLKEVNFSSYELPLSETRIPSQFKGEYRMLPTRPRVRHRPNQPTSGIDPPEDMLKALQNMGQLETFVCRGDTSALEGNQHGGKFLKALLRNKPCLRKIRLCSGFVLSDETVNPFNDRKLDGKGTGKGDTNHGEVELDLDYLFLGMSGGRLSPIALHPWVKNSSQLASLAINPGYINPDFAHLSIPSIKSLSILGDPDDIVNTTVTAFLNRHSSIEALLWDPLDEADPIVFAPGVLPNLRELRTGILVLDALEASYQASSSRKKYAIKSLDILAYRLESLLDLECLQREALLMFGASATSDDPLKRLQEFAEAFLFIERLALPSYYFSALTLDQWIDTLARFSNLQVLVYCDICELIKWLDDIGIQDAVTRLAKSCPKLRSLPYIGREPEPFPLFGRVWRTTILRAIVDGKEEISFELGLSTDSNKEFDLIYNMFAE